MTETMNIAEYRKLKSKRRSKYGNTKTLFDGIQFDSKKEAYRYQELLLMQKVGMITLLKYHERFPLIVNGQKVCDYESDFTYYENGMRIVEDVKSEATRKNRVYRLKRKLFEAIYKIEIREV